MGGGDRIDALEIRQSRQKYAQGWNEFLKTDMDRRARQLTARGAFRVAQRDADLVGAVGLVKRHVAVAVVTPSGKGHVDKRCSSPGVSLVLEHLAAGRRRLSVLAVDGQRAIQEGQGSVGVGRVKRAAHEGQGAGMELGWAAELLDTGETFGGVLAAGLGVAEREFGPPVQESSALFRGHDEPMIALKGAGGGPAPSRRISRRR